MYGHFDEFRNRLKNEEYLKALRRKKLYKKKKELINDSYLKKIDDFDFPKTSDEELKNLKNEIKNKASKKNKKEQTIFFLSILTLLLLAFYFLRDKNSGLEHNKELLELNEKEEYLIENINEYTFLVEDGNKWVEKGRLKNAIYRYEQAVKLFPNEFDANYRLALAYSYTCKNNNSYCEKGLKLTNRLISSFPERKNLLELKIKFENINNNKLNNTK